MARTAIGDSEPSIGGNSSSPAFSPADQSRLNDAVRKSTADTITADHTFTPDGGVGSVTAQDLAVLRNETALNSKFSAYGAVADGVADDTAALQAAITAAGVLGVRTLWLADGIYRTTAALNGASGVTIRSNGGATLRPTSGTAVNFDGLTAAAVDGVVVDGVNSVAGDVISLNNAVRCKVRECEITAWTDSPQFLGCILVEGTSTENEISDNYIHDMGGTCIGLSGAGVARNKVERNVIHDNRGFGVRVGSSANHNEIAFNSTTLNDFELVGITSDGYGNRLIANHAQGSGDNGISVSGSQNVVVANKCILNDRAGIHVWGSFNTVVGNSCISNNQEASTWAGIGVSANFGGTGQHNTITGNFCDDDQAVATQTNGVRIAGNSYTLWANGQVITTGDFRYFGLNVYQATTSGTTGLTAPVHTTGTASDDNVTWRYVRTFLTSADSIGNTVASNSVPRAASNLYVDTGGWVSNTLISRDTTDHRVTGASYRIGVNGSLFFNVNGTDEARLDSATFRPETDLSIGLGLTNRRFSSIHSAAYHAGPSGSTVQVVGSRRTGWTAPTGTATRTAFDTATVTTAQLAERVKALLDDLITHGLIGS